MLSTTLTTTLTILDLPYDIFYNLIEYIDICDFHHFCRIHLSISLFYNKNKIRIIQYYLKKHQVKYEEETCLIYYLNMYPSLDDYYNKININTVKNEDNSFDYLEVFKLFLKLIYAKEIKVYYEVTSIPILPNLFKLDISHCNHLKNIPMLPKLRVLCMIKTKLHTIPDFPNLLDLNISNNQYILKLPKLEKLIYLDVSRCHHLTSLNNMSLLNIEHLDISNSSITVLPYENRLSKLYLLNISYTNINKIPNYKLLRILNISGCRSLRHIPSLPELQYIYCISWIDCPINFEDYRYDYFSNNVTIDTGTGLKRLKMD